MRIHRWTESTHALSYCNVLALATLGEPVCALIIAVFMKRSPLLTGRGLHAH